MTKAIMTLTDAAAERVKALMAKAEAKGEAVAGVRLSIKTTGCNGHSYDVNYAAAAQKGDEVVEDKGVTVFVDPLAVMMLIGTEMDYEADPFRAGFVFHNPNEKARCGCGESFTI